ncbi:MULTISPECIES: TIGR04282 family arsenosugar biosynthesis glycosyltransferase [unclassified Tolypothrix]|uniref:TIGR04282 family arsenosugar biosynthesis glycosyltransferase n=1 Tax=unclassified Tolypothrix TaxID=2649714 RepID=UPI0005F821FF|nr:MULTISPECIES: TIGR04282 family arsenosugar biosynthesis glycosyltransferase [unclassified Tolypothrix]MBE9082661.1 TIGR04282 family arsenosugar biosynthesis glycosyltransferase [Tolypothrix sp. LEGE 11397]UYD29959.1 TIGR04282 family arsenosugar biosynthesis glycosyltransferase [Tolypothrix sp. PCC 7712]UYD37589.1 TIGR04282 family arsenosugar biosynthesis glycosyltransferase [Tolypothrix sp. PCC 7601]
MQSLYSLKHLIIFTRYPEAGKTKTRLIPALGELGAANLQKQMTEYTILQVQALQKILAISFEVRFAGGNLQLMQDWLGSDLVYQPQGEGDLGDRMMRSLADAVASGKQQIIIIGIDCPGVNSQLLAMAFEQLDNFDMVLGPAMDGGYYLIGLRQSIPQLFANIDWGTSQVFSQTLDIAQQLNLSRADLPTLVDVDRPEDLPIWEQTIAREVADKTQ